MLEAHALLFGSLGSSHHPEFYQVGVYETKIVATGVSQGRTLIEPGGRQIFVMEKVDQDSFYSYLLEQFVV